jgi:hypothetical protein
VKCHYSDHELDPKDALPVKGAPGAKACFAHASIRLLNTAGRTVVGFLRGKKGAWAR